MRKKLQGEVIVGKQIGHTIGFPTANIKVVQSQCLPGNGVYIGEISIEALPGVRRCIVNQGMQPTLPSGHRAIEAFILDFDQVIYGRSVTLVYLHRLRDERMFDSTQALVAQIKLDIEQAKLWTDSMPTF